MKRLILGLVVPLAFLGGMFIERVRPTPPAPNENLPFSSIIETTTGHRILPCVPETDPETRSVLDFLGANLPGLLSHFNKDDSPTNGLRRINEASRFFEDRLIEELSAHPDFTCRPATTTEGKKQRSGYPDLELIHLPSGRTTYLDPKLYEQTNRNSSLRTFYFEPKTRTSKILTDAHHLIIGIAHDGNDGSWKFLDWTLVDLSQFRVRLKREYQGSNRDLYREELIVGEGGIR
ncbi:MAG: hypothetical protein AAF514_21170 [Verrucomicrobiota bacterium]